MPMVWFAVSENGPSAVRFWLKTDAGRARLRTVHSPASQTRPSIPSCTSPLPRTQGFVAMQPVVLPRRLGERDLTDCLLGCSRSAYQQWMAHRFATDRIGGGSSLLALHACRSRASRQLDARCRPAHRRPDRDLTKRANNGESPPSFTPA